VCLKGVRITAKLRETYQDDETRETHPRHNIISIRKTKGIIHYMSRYKVGDNIQTNWPMSSKHNQIILSLSKT